MTKQEKYIPKKGDYISLGGVFSGIAQEIYISESGDRIAKIFLVKNAFQRGSAELHNLSSPLLGDLRPATKDELLREIAMRQTSLEKDLEKFNVQKYQQYERVPRVNEDASKSDRYFEDSEHSGSTLSTD